MLVREPRLSEALGSDIVRRIEIAGTRRAGRTTLARELGGRLVLPVVHLDRVFWRPGWTEPPPEEWQRAHRAALSGKAWIADVNYGSTIAERIALSDQSSCSTRRRSSASPGSRAGGCAGWAELATIFTALRRAPPPARDAGVLAVPA